MTSSTDAISRRGFLSAVTGIGLGVVAAGSGVSEGADADVSWTQPGATAGKTSWLPEGTGPTGELTTAWSVGETRDGSKTEIGAIVNGTVYAADSAIRAYDATDGTERWSVKATVPQSDYDDSMRADIAVPSVVNDIVLAPVRIGNENETAHATIVAVEADSGSKRWQLGVDSPKTFSPLTAYSDSVFCCGPALSGSNQSYVYRIDAQGSSILWQAPIDLDTPGQNTALVADGRVFVAETEGVTALDAPSGKVLWDALPDVNARNVPAVWNDTLIVWEAAYPGSTLIALDVITGTELWKTAYGGETIVAVEAIDDDRVYLSMNNANTIIALDRSDGSELWRETLPETPPTDDRSPTGQVPTAGLARVGSLLYAGGSTLDPTDGTIRSTTAITRPEIGGLELAAVVDERCYFHGGSMHVLESVDAAAHTDDSKVTPDENTPNSDTPITQPNSATTDSRSPDKRTETIPATSTEGAGFGLLGGAVALMLAGWRQRSS
ncbi:outer membrane protein assembly factor BamB family protein [Halocatena halophila]|uniref:outer membrane protein assembly factor BamB family protein n=1 Tax=Halocatena halophila TaxID=2814576 RepID=UPI002ED562A2